jgi:hypothetical protein
MKRQTHSQLLVKQQSLIKEAEYLKSCGMDESLENLLYMQQRIERMIIPHEIVNKMKLYYNLNNKIPIELIIHIASFGDITDIIAVKYVDDNIQPTIEEVDP